MSTAKRGKQDAPDITDVANETPRTTLDPFRPENLRLPQGFTELGVKRIVNTVLVRRPGRQDFIRVHPDPAFRCDLPIIELKDDREEYVVVRELVPELGGEVVAKTLYTAITRQGVVFLWPVRLPTPEGKDTIWWTSARDAAARATQSWIRVTSNMNLGAYECWEASGNLGEPKWPELGFWDLIRVAFQTRIIDRLDHPVLKRLRGEA
jgi:hypothetical protein